MFRLVYMSTANYEFTNEELDNLLEKSRKNNAEKHISGLLIVKGRTFIQCLEGEQKDVLYIYDKIQKDTRHRDLIELIEEEAEDRYFPNWEMGYKNIRNLTNVESEKLKDFALEDTSSLDKNEVSQLFKRFIEDQIPIDKQIINKKTCYVTESNKAMETMDNLKMNRIKGDYTIIKFAKYSLEMVLNNKAISDNLITSSEKDILLSSKNILAILEARFKNSIKEL